MAEKLTPKSTRAIRNYGLDSCLRAYAMHKEGYGDETKGHRSCARLGTGTNP
jgi:hypothetical protein